MKQFKRIFFTELGIYYIIVMSLVLTVILPYHLGILPVKADQSFAAAAAETLLKHVKTKYPEFDEFRIHTLFQVETSEGFYAMILINRHKSLSNWLHDYAKPLPPGKYVIPEVVESIDLEVFVDKNLNVEIREIGRRLLIGFEKQVSGNKITIKWITTPGVKLSFTYEPLRQIVEQLREGLPMSP